MACAACNLHTAIALVSKMKAMGILASCNQAGNAAHSRPGKAEAAAQQAAGATLCLGYGMLHLETWADRVSISSGR